MIDIKISRKLLLPGLLLLILILFAFLPSYAPKYKIILLSNILMYIIITVSWSIFSGPTGYISLATAAFFGVGVYTMAVLGNILPLVIVIIIAGLVSFMLALLIGALTLRLKGIYFTIFTFGLVELIKYSLLWWEINIMGTRGRFVVIVDSNTIYYIMLAIFVVLMIIAYFIKNSKIGLALESIGEHEEAAAHIGINVTLLKVSIFALSALFMGMTGGIIATRWTYIDPQIAFNSFYSFMPVVMAVFGGMGQLYGPVIGAAFFSYLEELLVTNFPYFYMIIFGSILIITILYLPNGLVGLVNLAKKKFHEIFMEEVQKNASG